jgi:hypothetical protein
VEGSGLKVFVVWEKVLSSDTDAPIEETRARISDPRAAQYWDPDRLVSNQAQGVLSKDDRPMVGKPSLARGPIVWDYAAVYPPGVRWEQQFPLPAFQGAPVVKVTRELADSLRATLAGAAPAPRAQVGSASEPRSSKTTAAAKP